MKRQSSEALLDHAARNDSSTGDEPPHASCSTTTSEEVDDDVVASPDFKRQASFIFSIHEDPDRGNLFGLDGNADSYVEDFRKKDCRRLVRHVHPCPTEQPLVDQVGARTGLVFASSPEHYDLGNPLHRERQQRISSIFEALESAGFLDRCMVLQQGPFSLDDKLSEGPRGLSVHRLERQLTEQDFARVHRLAYLKR
jgi:hypothetical protein